MNNNKKPKVLYVFSTMPCPPQMGVHHRVLNMGRQLKKYAEVSFVYLGKPCRQERIAATKKEWDSLHVMPSKGTTFPGIPASLVHSFKFHWPWYHADKVSHADKVRFFKLCQSHDIIWFHTLRPADSLGQHAFVNAIVDLDDLNQNKFRQRRWIEKTCKAKIAISILSYKWRRWEQKAKNRFPWLAVCSEEDCRFLGKPEKTFVLPNGYVLPNQEPLWQDRTEKVLGFIGFIGYAPNRHGLEWFGEQVWPKVIKRIPDARLRVMGHMPEPDRFQRFARFDLLGFVEDAETEMARWSGLVVPLHFGGGTRLKILDAFSKKCPVVSTQIGAHGLNICHEKNILLADNADAFAEQCIRILNEPPLGRMLAEGGWELFREQYTWDNIGKRVEDALKRMLHPK